MYGVHDAPHNMAMAMRMPLDIVCVCNHGSNLVSMPTHIPMALPHKSMSGAVSMSPLREEYVMCVRSVH